ncbi:MAG: arsenate reductase ArsC [Deltaproteobacteria bacterium]|jgi:arsenate reductase (thioredoxin)|nr:arsenate reductase ArsC [Deltaproteobacteria bacterium]
MKTILFMCMGNACRSQMAEGYAKELLPDGWHILSAGIVASGIHPLTVEVMNEDAIDISQQTSRKFEDLGNISPDIVVTLCDEAEELCPSYTDLVRHDHWEIDDPALTEGLKDEKLKDFRRARDEIKLKMQELSNQLNN